LTVKEGQLRIKKYELKVKSLRSVWSLKGLDFGEFFQLLFKLDVAASKKI